MTQSQFDANGLQFAWNSTSIKLAQECLMKYKLITIDGWQSPHLSMHLRFGQHYAKALESFHKARADGVHRDAALEDVVHEALIASWDFEYDEEGNPFGGEPWETGDSAKNRPNLIRSIIWYLDHFEDDAMSTIILASGAAAVEHSITLDVDNGLLFTGHIDRMVDYAHHPYVQDQKTTKSTITQRYFEGYSPDTQMSMYTFLAKAAFQIPVKGVVIDAAQIAVGFTRFERGFTSRSDSQLNEWYDNTMHDIERARTAHRENFFPMNPTACSNYGGCMFRHACSRSPEVREQFLKADFVKGTPMNPLEHR